MTMKKIIVMCSLVAALFSCAKEKHADPVDSTEFVEVMLNFESDEYGGQTKAVEQATDAEKQIKSIEVFAYNEHSKLVGYQKATTTNDFKIRVPVGSTVFYAVANAATTIGEDGALDLATLLSRTDVLRERYPVINVGSPMFGKSGSFLMNRSGLSASINLKRNLSRVDVQKITNATTGIFAKSPITITRIWLTNIVASYMLNGTTELSDGNKYVPTEWFSKVGLDFNGLYQDGVKSFTPNLVLASGESYTTPHYFYACPNPYTNDAPTTTWAPAATYFNLRCQMLGTTYEFKFKLPELVANNVYQIQDVKICGTGALVEASLTFSVGDWIATVIGESGVVNFGEDK